MKPLAQMAILFDFYGQLLTPRQQELLRAYYLDDLSLGEIAGAEHVSRQAVHDQIKRAEQSLQEFEEKLGLVAEYRRQQEALAQLRLHLAAATAALPAGSPARAPLAAACRLAATLFEPDPAPLAAGDSPGSCTNGVNRDVEPL